MAVDEINPYQSPIGIDDAPARLGAPSVAVRLARALGLGFIGYGVFAAAIVLSSSSQVVDWWDGLLVALVFAFSEVLNTGRGHAAGILRRIGICGLIMLATVFCFAVFGDETARTNNPMQLGPRFSSLLAISLFFATCVVAVRFVWNRGYWTAGSKTMISPTHEPPIGGGSPN